MGMVWHGIWHWEKGANQFAQWHIIEMNERRRKIKWASIIIITRIIATPINSNNNINSMLSYSII
jgi:hypothetical protein